MTIGHAVHWVWPVPRSPMCPPANIQIFEAVYNLLKATCCKLLVEHRGGQGEEEEVVGDMEGGVPVDDNVSWLITLLARPST